MHRPFNHSTGVGKILDGMALFRQQHGVVPDGGRACDARDIDHRGAIVVARPHAHYEIGGIAHCPVIFEIVGGACLGGRRAHRLAHSERGSRQETNRCHSAAADSSHNSSASARA